MSKRPNRIPQATTPAPALMPNPHHRRQKNPGSGVGRTLQPGEQRVVWANYLASPPTSKRISLNVPKFRPFEDIPVSK